MKKGCGAVNRTTSARVVSPTRIRGRGAKRSRGIGDEGTSLVSTELAGVSATDGPGCGVGAGGGTLPPQAGTRRTSRSGSRDTSRVLEESPHPARKALSPCAARAKRDAEQEPWLADRVRHQKRLGLRLDSARRRWGPAALKEAISCPDALSMNERRRPAH